jgi:hypothetical protein
MTKHKRPSMTHTFAVLAVPGSVYAAVRALLTQAGYDHAFHEGTDGEVIDLHGIALKARDGGATNADVTVSTLLSSRTKEGRVELTLNGELTQMDLPKAREIVGMLQEAIEAAASDQMLYVFLTVNVGLKPEQAAAALVDFREIRQGSRGLVHPS